MSDDIILLTDFAYYEKIISIEEEIRSEKQDLIRRDISFTEESYGDINDIKTWFNAELANNTQNTKKFKSYIEQKLKYQYHQRTGYFGYLSRQDKPDEPKPRKKFPRWAKIMFGIIGGALMVGIVLSVVLGIVLK